MDSVSFEEDLLKLPMITEMASTLEDLLAQYNEGLSSVLDRHAPLIKRRNVCERCVHLNMFRQVDESGSDANVSSETIC